ncbi:MAG TPA: (2Fe-2S)-binding protein [Roseateles sp.]|nr:(2Fe-2S)-binding protein [Roseateles sp.]
MSEPFPAPGAQRFVRLAETGRAAVTLSIDGQRAQALQGDSLLVALLSQRGHLRRSEFGAAEARAGFCLMGACQDCWVWDESGSRLRACSTPVAEGMAVCTAPPAHYWPATPDLKIVQEREA